MCRYVDMCRDIQKLYIYIYIRWINKYKCIDKKYKFGRVEE